MNIAGTKQVVDSRVSGFDEERDYYVFEYVYDVVGEDYTEHEGDVVDIVRACNSIDALEKAGLDDYNRYSAKALENAKEFKNAILNERKLLNKLNKKIDGLIEEREEKKRKILEDRECPNGCGKMDKAWRCKSCGFGHEKEQMLKDLNTAIKEEKKRGNDVTHLDALKKTLKKAIAEENKLAKE